MVFSFASFEADFHASHSKEFAKLPTQNVHFLFCQGTSTVSSRRLAPDLGRLQTQIILAHWDTLGLRFSRTYHVPSGATSI